MACKKGGRKLSFSDRAGEYKAWESRNKSSLILVLNCGSSSIKFSLFEYDQKQLYRLLDGNFKNLHTQPLLEILSSKGKQEEALPNPIEIQEGLKQILNVLSSQWGCPLSSLSGIGHRFVHGGDKYSSAIRVNRAILTQLQQLSDLAPLHNEACLLGIQACLDIDDQVPQIVVFDTTFHRTLPPVASHYAIPSDIASKYSIKRYGFHGISHCFLWKAFESHCKESSKNAKIITLHLGNGCSMTAIAGGVSVETSMGFTPSEGLVMATRAGDIDAAVIEFLCIHGHKTVDEVMKILNFESGLQGVSSLSSDMKTLLDVYQNNGAARLAVDLFCYRILKYLGAYIAVLGGVDAVIFSGGIGENSPIIREKILSKMGWMGWQADKQLNEKAVKLAPGMVKEISATSSTIPIYVIATDENFLIAEEVCRKINDF